MNNSNSDNSDVQLVEQLNHKVAEVKAEIAKVIVGQDEIINQLIISLLSRFSKLLFDHIISLRRLTFLINHFKTIT